MDWRTRLDGWRPWLALAFWPGLLVVSLSSAMLHGAAEAETRWSVAAYAVVCVLFAAEVWRVRQLPDPQDNRTTSNLPVHLLGDLRWVVWDTYWAAAALYFPLRLTVALAIAGPRDAMVLPVLLLLPVGRRLMAGARLGVEIGQDGLVVHNRWGPVRVGWDELDRIVVEPVTSMLAPSLGVRIRRVDGSFVPVHALLGSVFMGVDEVRERAAELERLIAGVAGASRQDR